MLLIIRTIVWSNDTSFCYEGTRTCAACWTSLWHLDALCYEGLKGMGQQMGYRYRSLEWNGPKEAMNIPIGAGILDGAKMFKPFS